MFRDEFSVAKQIVYEYSDIFSQSEFVLGHTAALPHHIDTGDAWPFKEQLRTNATGRSGRSLFVSMVQQCAIGKEGRLHFAFLCLLING